MAQFPLIDQASLVMASGAYKEGKIYSQLPTDGSGDFTFTRGTDTATRVNKDGYIEKERVNLLLQSNSFSDTTWTKSSASVTGGQAGYDGSNDAWLLSKLTTGGYIISNTSSVTGVTTLSCYAKSDSLNYFRIDVGKNTGYSISYFDLTGDGAIGGSGNSISSSIENVGNGWFRCSVSVEGNVSYILLIPADTISSQATTGSIYIQDAQLNQGLVAYPYLETTTAPVYAGLTDNMPRLDYSGGAECPSLLLEPSRVNLLTQSEYFGDWDVSAGTLTANAGTSPEGLGNAYKLVENTSFGGHYIITASTVSVTSGSAYTQSIFVKENGRTKIGFRDSQGSGKYASFDLSDGTLIEQNGDGFSIEPFENGWYKISVTMDASGVYWRPTLYLLPDSYTTGSPQLTSYAGDGTSGVYIYGAQLEQGSYATSYIPTYGSSQTRAADVPTLSKTLPSEGSLFINVGGTSQPKLSVLGEYFDASTTSNKVAIAYSSAALVISHNGSIVVDKTGTYDVSSLTQIQLGHSNGADQADSPISEFVTFDSFLTNNELNALTQ